MTLQYPAALNWQNKVQTCINNKRNLPWYLRLFHARYRAGLSCALTIVSRQVHTITGNPNKKEVQEIIYWLKYYLNPTAIYPYKQKSKDILDPYYMPGIKLALKWINEDAKLHH